LIEEATSIQLEALMTTRMKYILAAIAISVAMWAGIILGTVMFWRFLHLFFTGSF
jgi:hypothetical protein